MSTSFKTIFSAILCVLVTGAMFSSYAGFLDKLDPNKLKDAIKNVPRNLNDRGDQSDSEDEGEVGDKKKLVDVVAATVSVVGLNVCRNKGGDQKAQLLCQAGSYAAGYMVNTLGDRIVEGLDAKEQRRVLGGISTTLHTGEPLTIELPDSNSTVGITPVGDGFYSSQKIKIYLDTAIVQGGLPTVEILGTEGKSKSKIKLSAEPEKGKTSGSVKKNKPLHVFGKVAGSDTLLVGRGDSMVIMDGEWEPLPYAIGYAASSDVQFDAPGMGTLRDNSDIPDNYIRDDVPKTLASVEIDAIMLCREVGMTKTDNSTGGEVSDSYVQCAGPNGTPIQLEKG